MQKVKSKSSQSKLLTETELELMSIIWELGEGNVAQVIEQLPRTRNLAYTSVSTILRILEQKKVLKTRKEGRGHVYIPLLKRNEFEVKTVKHMVERVFNGTPVALVRQLLDAVKLNEADLLELKDLIDQAGRKK